MTMKDLAPIPATADLRGLTPREVSHIVLLATPEEYREVMGAQLDAANLHYHQLSLPRILADLLMYRQISETLRLTLETNRRVNEDHHRSSQYLIQKCFGEDPSDQTWIDAAHELFGDGDEGDRAAKNITKFKVGLDMQLLLAIAKVAKVANRSSQLTD